MPITDRHAYCAIHASPVHAHNRFRTTAAYNRPDSRHGFAADSLSKTGLFKKRRAPFEDSRRRRPLADYTTYTVSRTSLLRCNRRHTTRLMAEDRCFVLRSAKIVFRIEFGGLKPRARRQKIIVPPPWARITIITAAKDSGLSLRMSRIPQDAINISGATST